MPRSHEPSADSLVTWLSCSLLSDPKHAFAHVAHIRHAMPYTFPPAHSTVLHPAPLVPCTASPHPTYRTVRRARRPSPLRRPASTTRLPYAPRCSRTSTTTRYGYGTWHSGTHATGRPCHVLARRHAVGRHHAAQQLHFVHVLTRLEAPCETVALLLAPDPTNPPLLRPCCALRLPYTACAS